MSSFPCQQTHISYLNPSHPSQQYMSAKKIAKTYNSWDSRVVTHRNTSQPVPGLSTADRTGSPVLPDLWSYVKERILEKLYIAGKCEEKGKKNK